MKSCDPCNLSSIILMAVLFMIAGCKKDSDNPSVSSVPVFSVSYKTVLLQSGGDGLQFSAKCTNNSVIMESAAIFNPDSSYNIRDFKGTSYSMNQAFNLQSDEEAYSKAPGTWRFSFVGSANSTPFAIDTTLVVSK
jgi:hypothetical protein